MTENQIDDLAARESSSDGADAKESTDKRKGAGGVIGPAAYRCTCGDGEGGLRNGPCSVKDCLS